MNTTRKTRIGFRITTICLVGILFVSSLGGFAFATGNVRDTDFTAFNLTTSDYTDMSSYYAREKLDDTALYLLYDAGPAYAQVRARGANTQYGTYYSKTRANGKDVDHVTCRKNVGYSIHSMINESKNPVLNYAKFMFKSNSSSYTSLSGVWSPDTQNQHTDATLLW